MEGVRVEELGEVYQWEQWTRNQRKPGQAWFVKRGGSGVRGPSRSSPQLTLPSFSTEDEDDDDEEDEVDFPNQEAGQHQRQTVQAGKQLRKPIAI